MSRRETFVIEAPIAWVRHLDALSTKAGVDISAMRCQPLTTSAHAGNGAQHAPMPVLLVSVKDTAAALGVSERSVYRLVENGDLITITVGEGAVRVPAHLIHEYVERLEQEAAAAADEHEDVATS